MLFVLSVGVSAADEVADLRARADAGDARAQYLLGGRYSSGWGGVPQDDRQALKWFLRAAKQGHAGAQYILGLEYSSRFDYQQPRSGTARRQSRGIAGRSSASASAIVLVMEFSRTMGKR